ncbi:hypothetical protein C5167_025642 [Papaver somniferum]|uniref:Uncharacterized protein n=1 Tax=Papaver somniferum TaxID=3469 RepID=A0A4Y7JV04_PAPSO|nr:hypothetical protein C5167_025642 [Papaver somniferum]
MAILEGRNLRERKKKNYVVYADEGLEEEILVDGDDVKETTAKSRKRTLEKKKKCVTTDVQNKRVKVLKFYATTAINVREMIEGMLFDVLSVMTENDSAHPA